jgi:GGDEF domain-containing protein
MILIGCLLMPLPSEAERALLWGQQDSQSAVKMCLRQFEQLQASRGDSCTSSTANRCPKALGRLQTEDYSSKLVVLDSRADSCMMHVDPTRTLENYSQFKNAKDMQAYMAKTRFPELGLFNHGQIQACQGTNDVADRYQTAKFYYEMKRLNIGAVNIVDELAGIRALLGDEDSFGCEGKLTLPQATARCDVLKQCKKETGNLEKIAAESEQQEPAYQATMKELKELEKGCLRDAKEIHSVEKDILGKSGVGEICREFAADMEGVQIQRDCIYYTKKDLEKIKACESRKQVLAIAEVSLASKYPWFRNKDFFIDRNTMSSEATIKKLSLENREALIKRYDDFLNAGQCLNGLAENSKEQNCNNDKIRTALNAAPQLIPDLSLAKPDKAKFITAELYLSAQSCIAQGVEDQKQAGQVIKSALWDAGLSGLAVVLTGGLAGIGRVALGLRGLKTAENVAQVAKLSANAGRTFNLGFDGFNLGSEVIEIAHECQEKLYSIDLADRNSSQTQNQCPSYQSAKAQAEKDYSDCLGAGAFARLGGAMAPFAIPKVVQGAKNAAEALHMRKALEADRRIHAADLPQARVARNIREVNMPGTNENLRVYKNRRENGEIFETFDYVVDIPGKGKRLVTSELPRDPLTGAIDANMPSGKKFLELQLLNLQGKGHVAFLDVGNLGFVNREFAGGMKTGDEYLKRVSHVIKSVGKDKITLVKLGGDEFAIVIHEVDPVKAKALMEEVSKKIGSKNVHEIFSAESAIRAQAYRDELYKKFPDADPAKLTAALEGVTDPEARKALAAEFERKRAEIASSDEYQAMALKFKQEYVPYSKETASIGMTETGVGDVPADAIERADKASVPMKVEGKVLMNQDATKQNGPPQDKDPNRKIDPRKRPEVADPTPAPTGREAIPLHRIDYNLPRMVENEVREVGRYNQFSVVEYSNELGETSYKLKKYAIMPDGTKKHIDYELGVNGKTGLLDGNTARSREFLEAVIKERKNTGIIWLDMPALGKVNYFEGGTKIGDQYLEAAGKAIKSALRKDSVGFKYKGSEFILEVGQLDKKALEIVQARVKNALANSQEIKDIFNNQQRFLEGELAKNPGSKELLEKLEQFKKVRHEVDIANTITHAEDNLQDMLNRTREVVRSRKPPK